MIQAGNDFGLAFEPLTASDIFGELGGKNFYGDGAVEAGVERAVNLTHAARAERRHNLVRT